MFHGAHDVRLEEVPEPTRRPGEALLRVRRSGMCGTDASEWTSGPRMFPVQQAHPVTAHHGPMVLGHEFVGEVVEPDPDGALSVGDLVACGAGVWCGECDRCRAGRTNLCRRYFTLGLSVDGGMAELVSAPERTLVRIPDSLTLDAAGLAQPVAVGLHAARRTTARPGDTVVLLGAGAIGSFVLAGLISSGVGDVTVVDFPGTRLERARRLGAAHTVPVGPDLADEIRDLVGGAGADIVVEASGAPGQLDQAAGLVRSGGTVLQVGLPKGPQQIDVHSLVMREVSVLTTLAHVCDDDLGEALGVLASTTLADELLDSVRPLEDLPDQLERLASGHLEGKVLFDPALMPGS